MRDLEQETPSEQAQRLQELAAALAGGIVVVDEYGDVVWMDGATRKSIDGELSRLAFPLHRADRTVVDCFLAPVDVEIAGHRKSICVVQQSSPENEAGHDLIAGIEAVMADSSWFSRTITERLKAWLQVRRPSGRSTDVDRLTEREREILALICDGKSSAQMGKLLGLSQNTVRNHVTSLYRKIGVNSRSNAMVWARERALTAQDILTAKSRRRERRDA